MHAQHLIAFCGEIPRARRVIRRITTRHIQLDHKLRRGTGKVRRMRPDGHVPAKAESVHLAITQHLPQTALGIAALGAGFGIGSIGLVSHVESPRTGASFSAAEKRKEEGLGGSVGGATARGNRAAITKPRAVTRSALQR